MLTPVLEKLILSGKAAYKTFVAGGSEKHILSVPNDRYIVITDIVYQSSINTTTNKLGQINADQLASLYENMNTQVKIFSQKSNNSFLFRNSFNVINKGADYILSPIHSAIKLDTYLVHEENVSITFSTAGDRKISDTGLTLSNNPGYPAPFDYGKEGQAGAEPVARVTRDTKTFEGVNHQGQNYASDPMNSASNLEFIFPVNSSHYPILNGSQNYPFVILSYVEIKGNLTNIEMTS